jgi:tetratricopeptide (TPR) repeat protein
MGALAPSVASDAFETAVRAEAAGKLDQAISGYDQALSADPSSPEARRALALVLVRAGRRDEAITHLRAELADNDAAVTWMINEVTRAMEADDLRFAGDLAAILSALRFGATWESDSARPPVPERKLSVGKLRHDAEQLRHLLGKNALGPDVEELASAYERVADRLAASGYETRMPLAEIDDKLVLEAYGRILHRQEAPRLPKALSDSWDANRIQDAYLARQPMFVVVDNFLTNEALESLRRFSRESTIWLGNRYPSGRLGSFFVDGFNSPLLLQIAEELRDRLGRIIGEPHPLRQLWGFKYPPSLAGDTTIHADFAAVNVNFWIMPEEANLDPTSGGLVVYDLDAPLSWSFEDYNQRLDLIKDYIGRKRPRSFNIPYRANRAVIFNSDLFHATAQIKFRPEYEFRRVNITMLYGVRERDPHHRDPSTPPRHVVPDGTPAWRSAALSRPHRR